MRNMTKAQWKRAYHHYRHIAWMTRNYFAHKRSMGHRQTTWAVIKAAEKNANQPRELRLMFSAINSFAGSYLNRQFPRKEGYWWHTATINAPDDPYWKGMNVPHRLRVEDDAPLWHFVIGASPEHALEMMAAGKRVRWNHTVKLYCQNFKQWQQRLHAPTLAGSDEAPNMSPALGGDRRCAC